MVINALAQNSIDDAIQEIFDRYDYKSTDTIFPIDGKPIIGQLQFSFVKSAFVHHQEINENGEIVKTKYKPTEVKGFVYMVI